MNLVCIHSIVLTAVVALLIFHVVWFKFMLCGDEWNTKCYGKADFLTFIGKDIGEEHCGANPHDPTYCSRSLVYYFELNSEEIIFSNIYSDTEHCGYVGPIYQYDQKHQFQVGKQYLIFNACKHKGGVSVLVPLSQGGYTDRFETGTVPTRIDHDFCIAMFVICSLTIIIYLITLISKWAINKKKVYNEQSLLPGFAGGA